MAAVRAAFDAGTLSAMGFAQVMHKLRTEELQLFRPDAKLALDEIIGAPTDGTGRFLVHAARPVTDGRKKARARTAPSYEFVLRQMHLLGDSDFLVQFG